ncbi:MAG TPA: band-7 C-terminal domain-containing protein, partial [Thermoanaerobaculia bacterium]
AEGIRKVADALKTAGGQEAMQLRIAEQYITQFGNIARSANTMIVPANLADVASMLAMATGGLKVASSAEPKLSARAVVQT